MSLTQFYPPQINNVGMLSVGCYDNLPNLSNSKSYDGRLVVYWIRHKDWHNRYRQGYIGITDYFSSRCEEHFTFSHNEKVRELIAEHGKENVCIDLIHDCDKDEDLVLMLEEMYRYERNMFEWEGYHQILNKNKGGQRRQTSHGQSYIYLRDEDLFFDRASSQEDFNRKYGFKKQGMYFNRGYSKGWFRLNAYAEALYDDEYAKSQMMVFRGLSLSLGVGAGSHSPQWCASVSHAHTGKKHSAESRAKRAGSNNVNSVWWLVSIPELNIHNKSFHSLSGRFEKWFENENWKTMYYDATRRGKYGLVVKDGERSYRITARKLTDEEVRAAEQMAS